MKNRNIFVLIFVLCMVSYTISSVAADSGISIKRDLFAYLLDDCIRKCQAKIKLGDSRSKNIRKTAVLSALKAQYFYKNRYRLIERMLEADLPLKKYKVYHLESK